MTRDLFDEFLEFLCAKREVRPFFESMPGVITREKLSQNWVPGHKAEEHIQDRPKANHRLIKPLYFKDSLAEIVQYYLERDEKPSTEELMAQFELRDILQPGNPITGHREVSYQNEKERNFLSAIADAFPDVIKTLRISRHGSKQASSNHVSPETREQPSENISPPAATSESEGQGAETTAMSKKPLSKLASKPETKTDSPLSDALESEPQAAAKDGNAGTPRQGSRKFHPNQYGGKELCIVVSYSKAGKHNLKNLAKILTHKGKIQYDDYGDAQEWRRKNYETFKSHLSKLRRKAKDKGWWNAIPANYYLSYS